MLEKARLLAGFFFALQPAGKGKPESLPLMARICPVTNRGW